MADVSSDGVLTCGSGHTVPQLPVSQALFIDRTIAIYGPSGTGKTVITKHIMQTLQGHVDQAIVVAPSEPSNRSYAGFIDPPFIHYRMFLADPANPKRDDGPRGALRFLEAIWKRQEMMAAIYTRANNPEVLAQLYGRLPSAVHARGLAIIEALNEKRSRVIEQVRRQYAGDTGRRDEKVKDVNGKFKKMLVLIYKKFIAPEYGDLWARTDLSEDEKYSLAYLTFNPRLLLIFDDCAAQLKPFFTKDIFRLLFYQNRHSFITVIISCQDDTDLPANLRKNAFVSFFTEPVVCASNFERASNKFGKPARAYINDVASDIFRGNRKLAYIREDEKRQHFYHFECPYPKPFRFGSDAMRELTEAVQSTGVSMDKDNPYFDMFKL